MMRGLGTLLSTLVVLVAVDSGGPLLCWPSSSSSSASSSSSSSSPACRGLFASALPVGQKPFLYQGSGDVDKRKEADPATYFVIETIRRLDAACACNTPDEEIVEHFRARGLADAGQLAAVDRIVQNWRLKATAELLTDARPAPARDPRCANGLPDGYAIPPTYVINMQRRADRRRFMRRTLPRRVAQSPNFAFWPATDRKNVTTDWMARHGFKMYDKWPVAADAPVMHVVPGNGYRSHRPFWHNAHYWGRELNSGDMGCLISHVRLWREIVRRRHAYVVIFEDDVRVDERGYCEFVMAMDDLHRDGYAWDIAYSDTGKWFGDAWDVNTRDAAGRQQGPDERWARLGFTYSTWAMAVSLEGAKGLLDFGIHRCLHTIDDFVAFSYNTRQVEPWPHPDKANPTFGYPRAKEFLACLEREYYDDPQMFRYWAQDVEDGELPTVVPRALRQRRGRRQAAVVGAGDDDDGDNGDDGYGDVVVDDDDDQEAEEEEEEASVEPWREPRRLHALRWRGAEVVLGYMSDEEGGASDIDGSDVATMAA